MLKHPHACTKLPAKSFNTNTRRQIDVQLGSQHALLLTFDSVVDISLQCWVVCSQVQEESYCLQHQSTVAVAETTVEHILQEKISNVPHKKQE